MLAGSDGGDGFGGSGGGVGQRFRPMALHELLTLDLVPIVSNARFHKTHLTTDNLHAECAFGVHTFVVHHTVRLY